MPAGVLPLILVLMFTLAKDRLFSAAHPPSTPKDAGTSEDAGWAWQEDIEFLKTELPRKHKNLFHRTERAVWESELERLQGQLNEKSGIEIALSIQEIIAQMGDEHTGLDYWPLLTGTPVFPLLVSWFADGFYIIATSKEYAGTLGNRVDAINGIPMRRVMERLCRLLPSANEAMRRHRIPSLLPYAALLQHCKLIEGESGRFALTATNGQRQTILLEARKGRFSTRDPNTVQIIPRTRALHLANQRALFWSKFLEAEGVLYVQYNRCWGRELEAKVGSPERAQSLPSFVEFTEQVLHQLANPEVRKFVFDMRHNPGGSSPQGTQFVRQIARNARVNQKGRLFVVIGRRTFSSAILNALDFKRHTQAILIGEPTSGRPNHFGEVKRMQLPRSGLRIGYSTKYFTRVPGDPDSLVPDIRVETRFANFMAGLDPVLEHILKMDPR